MLNPFQTRRRQVFDAEVTDASIANVTMLSPTAAPSPSVVSATPFFSTSAPNDQRFQPRQLRYLLIYREGSEFGPPPYRRFLFGHKYALPIINS